MDEVKVGGETEAWCTTCKMMKNHVIVALVAEGIRPAKVECLGCGKQHVYRPHPPGTAKPRPVRSAAVKSPTPGPEDLDAKIAGKEARIYSPKERYVLEDVVTHPTFGKGLVIALPAAQKMEVAFSSGRKLLVHERGASTSPVLEPPKNRPHEQPTDHRVTDAPPVRDAASDTPSEG